MTDLEELYKMYFKGCISFSHKSPYREMYIAEDITSWKPSWVKAI